MRELRGVDSLVEQAVADTGLDDFGPFAWRDGLEAVVGSARAEADLNRVGVDILESWVLERLCNRLSLVEWTVRHPQVRGIGVEQPIVVSGMLRTGTTILLELLAADPANRPLMKWEALDSIPPPIAAGPAPGSPDPDPRIARWVQIMEDTYAMVPDLKAVHWEPGDGPTECVALLGQSFRSQDWLGLFHLPGYVDWYLSCDLEPAYAYHRLALQVLQSSAPGRWVLKAPGHLLALDALAATYPDVCLIVTHRDPLRTVASSVSLSTTSVPDSLTRDLVTGDWWGPMWLRMLGTMVDRMMDARDRLDLDVYDLRYADLVADPIASVRGIYDHLGRELTDEAEAAMRAHLAGNRQGRFGRHSYSLADSGLTEAQVDDRFARYRERFDIEREDPR